MSLSPSRLCVLVLFAASLAGCASVPSSPSSPPSAKAVAGDPCAAAAAQSPIPLTLGGASSDLRAPEIHYAATGVTLWNNGKDLQVDYSPGGYNYILLDGVRFDLVQFHFHRPAEHRINNVIAAMELHLVHEDAHGHVAVIGIPISVENPGDGTLNSLFQSIPPSSGWRQLHSSQLDASPLVPRVLQLAGRYSGSLTTPSYSECVRWTVIAPASGASLRVSQASFDAYRNRFPVENARPLQPINGRILRAVAFP